MLKKTNSVLSELLNKNSINYEIVFIDDGSRDKTWSIIKEVSKEDKNVVGVHFSRNFGKEAAILAGLANAKGDCCVVMDCDLQHPPETIIEMYRLWEQGYEVVEGVKASRGKESFLHGLSAKLFYKIMSKAVNIDMENASDFKLMDKRVVEAILNMPERNTFFRAMSSWVGFKKATVEFEVREREAGESKWSVFSLVRYAVKNIAAFSTVPMQIVTIIGMIMLIFALVVGVQTIYMYAMHRAVEGFTTVILLILIIGSIVMISLGIIGYYIAKIYEEVKRRPRYLISEIARKE